MSTKHIILAHGMGDEIGVPTDVRRSGLPWPRLAGDLEYLKDHSPVLILGGATYDLCRKWLGSDRLLLGVSATRADGVNVFDSLEMAIEAAERDAPDKAIAIGGGARLAAAAFELLQAEREGVLHETVVHGFYNDATAHMPIYDRERWTTPQVIHHFAAETRQVKLPDGSFTTEPVPAYHIQLRHVK